MNMGNLRQNLESINGSLENVKIESTETEEALTDVNERLNVLNDKLENFDLELRKSLKETGEKLEAEKAEILEQKELNQRKITELNKEYLSLKDQYSNELSELREVLRMQEENSELYTQLYDRYELLHKSQEMLCDLKDGGYEIDIGDPIERPESIEDVRCEKRSAEMVKEARGREPYLTETMKSCAASVGGKMAGLEYAVKGEDSLARKIKERVHNGISLNKAADSMFDVNRYTMVLEGSSFVEDANKAIETLAANGFELTYLKNTLKIEAAEYRGVNCRMRSKDGNVLELQFHTEQSLEIKEGNHPLYEEQRKETTTRSEKEKLGKLMVEKSSLIRKPARIDELKDYKEKKRKRR